MPGADKNPYRHDDRADKGSYRHDHRADSHYLSEYCLWSSFEQLSALILMIILCKNFTIGYEGMLNGQEEELQF